jgi:hypothetical protein
LQPDGCNRRRLHPHGWELWVLAASLLVACGDGNQDERAEGPPEGIASQQYALSTIDCTESTDTGYVQGNPFPITVVTVDGKKAEKSSANAYYVMAVAAANAGVNLKVVSAFRTMAEQTYLYNCYINCNCNNCNLAAKPGYSNHQSGHAFDLNTSAAGVYAWLNANAGAYGFKRTVPSEAWHWEWWGGGPGGGPCGSCKPACDGSKIIGTDCGVGDCGVYGATCVDDALGVRCVSVFCPALGQKKVCVNDKLIGDCKDGAISTGDCSVYGAFCSTAGGTEARCVSVFCAKDPTQPTHEHDVCMPDGRIAHCTALGGLTDAKDCPAGEQCVNGATTATCAAPAADAGTLADSEPDPGPATEADAEAPGSSTDAGLPRTYPGPVETNQLTGGCATAGAGDGAAWPAALLLLLSVLLPLRRRGSR